MTAKLTFHPLGNADCTRIDLADDRKILIDYADMRNPDDRWDTRIDLPTELKADLRAAKRDYYDTVCFTHLDNDHCCGAHDFFWWDHAKKYQGEGRIKIKTLWVPAGEIRLRSALWIQTSGLLLGRTLVVASPRTPPVHSSAEPNHCTPMETLPAGAWPGGKRRNPSSE